MKYVNLRNLIIFGIALRIIAAVFFYDFANTNYWEYGDIARNVIAGKGYSYFYFEGDELKYEFSQEAEPFPSAYMPPFYTFYMMSFLLIDSDFIRNVLFVLANIILSALIMLALYQFTLKRFSERTAIIAVAIYCFTPELVYASLSIGPTLIYQLFVLLLLTFLNEKQGSLSQAKIVLFSLTVMVLVALRAEMILLVLFVSVVLLMERNYKMLVGVLLAATIAIAPWAIRNYITFDKIMLTSTNGGINLYRGNNSIGPGTWGDGEVLNSLSKYKEMNNFELMMDKEFRNATIAYSKENPTVILEYSAMKLFHLLVYNQNDNRSTSLLILIPWFATFILAFIGLLRSSSFEKDKFVYVFIVVHIFVAVIFFALPRYQTMMKIALLPYAANAILILAAMYRKRISGN